MKDDILSARNERVEKCHSSKVLVCRVEMQGAWAEVSRDAVGLCQLRHRFVNSKI